MPDIICCEWAIAREHGLDDIVVADGNDTIVFPHVDSCCAFIFLMTDGSALGGHASVLTPTGDFGHEASAVDMLTRMLARACQAPGQIIAICNADDWDTAFPRAQARVAGLENCQATNHCGTLGRASDIFVALGPRRLQCQDWVSGVRADDAIPARTGTLTFDQPIGTLRRSNRGCCCTLF